MEDQSKKVMLGVPGLDAVFPEGIKAGSLVLIVGPPGSGKTLLAMQLLMEMEWRPTTYSTARPVKAEGPAMFLSADESCELLIAQRDSLLSSSRARSLSIGRLYSEGGPLRREDESLSPAGDDREALDLLLAVLRSEFPEVAESPRAIGLDGVANIPELQGASRRQRRQALRQMAVTLRHLMRTSAASPLAAVMTAELPTGPDEVGVSQLEEYLADVVIRLDVKETSPGKVRRCLEVPKARYVDSLLGEHSLWIMSPEEVERQRAAAATLGWSKEAMADIRSGVVVFPRMRWVRERGTGPVSSNLEDALRSLREHVSTNDRVPADVKKILEKDETANVLATILRGWSYRDLKWQDSGRQLERLFRAAVESGWQWPSKASVDEISSVGIRPLKLAWAEWVPEQMARMLLLGVRKILEKVAGQEAEEAAQEPGPASKNGASSAVAEMRLDKPTVEKLRSSLAVGFGLQKWSEAKLNAATMALLEVLAMVEYRLREPLRMYCTFGVRGLDEMFGTEDGGRGVTRGSSTVVVGGPGTGKSMLAYCFMLQGLHGESNWQDAAKAQDADAGKRQENGEKPQEDAKGQEEAESSEKRGEQQEEVIFLSFDERHKRVLRDAGRLTVVDAAGKPSRTLSEMAASQILESDIRSALDHPRFRFVYENPINADLDRLMHMLTKEIESVAPRREMLGGRERGRCRLIIDSLSDLERNIKDPRVFNNFVTTLLNKAIDWDVSTLVVYEATEDGAGKPMGRLLSFMADNVIVLQHVEVNNIARKSVRIRKARGRSHDPSVAELVFQRHRDGSFHVAVRKGFEGMSDVLSGRPRPAQIELRLFEENEPEKAWNEGFLEEMKALYSERVSLVPFRLEQIRAAFWHRLHQRDISPAADVTIVSMDQPWVRILARQESPLLSRWDPAEAGAAHKRVVGDLFDFLRKHASCDPGRPKCEQRMLALPLYHDVGLFLRRTDLPPGGHVPPTHWDDPAGAHGKPPDTHSLEGLLDKLLGPGRTALGDHVCGFAFDMDNVNGVACVFIEMCWNFGASETFFVTRDEDEAARNLDCATEAMLFLARLRWRKLLPYPCTLEHCANALYARLWYANLPNLAEHNPRAKQLQPQPFLLSASRRAESVSSPGETASKPWCCCGAWYLGVLSSGGNANLGWSIVVEALDPRRVQDRALSGAGLPPTESFYRLYGDREVPCLHETTFGQLRKEFLPQARSRMLAFGLGAVDSEGNAVTAAKMDVLSTMPEVLHGLVMGILGDPASHPDQAEAARAFVRYKVAKVLKDSGANVPDVEVLEGEYQRVAEEVAKAKSGGSGKGGAADQPDPA